MKNNKRAFTIVELVIVIAVIGILAAVLIPTFSSLIEKANMNSDEAAVKSMNTYLSADEQINGKPGTFEGAVKVLSKSGMDAQNYKSLSSEHYFVYDASINRVLYVEQASGQVVYPEEYKDLSKVEGYTYGSWLTLYGQMVADDSWANQEFDYGTLDVEIKNDGSVVYDNDTISSAEEAEDKVEGYQSYFGNNYAANLLVLEFKNNDTKYGVLNYKSENTDYLIAKVNDSQQLKSYFEYVKADEENGENFTLLLTGDVEFGVAEWKPIETYSGSIDGSYVENGEEKVATIKNLNMTDRSAEVAMYESSNDNGANLFYGFISVFDGDYLGNLYFEDVNVVTPGLDISIPRGFEKDGIYASAVVGLVANTAQGNTEVVVENIKVLSGTVTGYGRVGGLFGTVGMTSALAKSTGGYMKSGKILIKDCVNNANVVSLEQIDENRGQAGGIAATTHRISDKAVVNFENCTNNGNVTGENAAGICGRYNADTNFIGCENTGKITAKASNAKLEGTEVTTALARGVVIACGIACPKENTAFDTKSAADYKDCKNSGDLVVINTFNQSECNASIAGIAASIDYAANTITYSETLKDYKPTGKFVFDVTYFASLKVSTQGATYEPSVKGDFFTNNQPEVK